MEQDLFDKLVELIGDGVEDDLNLEEALVSEVLDMDEALSEEEARTKVRSFLDNYYIDAEDTAMQLNAEAHATYYDKLHDFYTCIGGTV